MSVGAATRFLFDTRHRAGSTMRSQVMGQQNWSPKCREAITVETRVAATSSCSASAVSASRSRSPRSSPLSCASRCFAAATLSLINSASWRASSPICFSNPARLGAGADPHKFCASRPGAGAGPVHANPWRKMIEQTSVPWPPVPWTTCGFGSFFVGFGRLDPPRGFFLPGGSHRRSPRDRG